MYIPIVCIFVELNKIRVVNFVVIFFLYSSNQLVFSARYTVFSGDKDDSSIQGAFKLRGGQAREPALWFCGESSMRGSWVDWCVSAEEGCQPQTWGPEETSTGDDADLRVLPLPFIYSQ